MNNDVLFYPQIGLTNPALIKSMALLYDNIYRICPDNVIPEDHPELAPLLEEGSIGRIIDPSSYAEDASTKFIEKLEVWDAAALSISDDDENYSLLHTEKTDQVVRDLFKDIGFKEENNWLYVPTEFASNFMLYMASDIATKNGLSLSTDSMAAWTATNYFATDGMLDDFIQPPGFDNKYLNDPFGIFNLLVSELTPVNISEIPAEDIIRFREQRRDEISYFRNCVFDLKKVIENTVDQDISIDRIEALAKELARAQNDYQKSADVIRAKKWFGSTMMGIPAPIGLCKLMSIPMATTMGIAATGIALGGLYSFASSREEIKKLHKDNPAAFLTVLHRDFKGYCHPTGTRIGGDINMAAWNAMEEYIAD
ncbi:hypothetical protein JYB88_12040 [Shewanella cyperi]|uniref:Uncharacterized protein n=1 Tax=Shewanella cyperi TaxID=2814292 RepID=A0A975AKA2_9GAMM|nr:DUF6236 family protein [Shewanella cyperi]QSX28983.1 hypothetical protein JYB88_12040 [Shewanella cyperi]